MWAASERWSPFHNTPRCPAPDPGTQSVLCAFSLQLTPLPHFVLLHASVRSRTSRYPMPCLRLGSLPESGKATCLWELRIPHSLRSCTLGSPHDDFAMAPETRGRPDRRDTGTSLGLSGKLLDRPAGFPCPGEIARHLHHLVSPDGGCLKGRGFMLSLPDDRRVDRGACIGWFWIGSLPSYRSSRGQALVTALHPCWWSRLSRTRPVCD